jgi:outer membrane protein
MSGLGISPGRRPSIMMRAKRGSSAGSFQLFMELTLVMTVFVLAALISLAYAADEDVLSLDNEAPIKITVQDAVLFALENNRSLEIERLNPEISRTFEQQEQARFDPVLDFSVGYTEEKREEWSEEPSDVMEEKTRETEAILGVSKFFATGTELGLDLSSASTWTDSYVDRHEHRVGLTVTQALLQGRGRDVNLARLRRAELDTVSSEYELRGFAEALAAEVEETYWNYALDQARIRIFEESLKLVEQQLRETNEMINVGKLAETELTAVQAERALRRQDLINARSSLATVRLYLIRLLNPPGPNPWDREILILNQPAVPDTAMDPVKNHVDVALRMRPDLNQARLELQKGELEVVETKNGLLPRMDLFITLGKTGYADSFGRSIKEISSDSYDVFAGLRFEYPFRNREARGRHKRVLLQRDQAEKAISNLSQLIETDVRVAYIEANRAKEQIAASSITRKLQEEKLRIETEKYRVGRSTSFLVAQVQRDLVSSQIYEVEAVVSYLKALVALHRLEGSLLSRRGISAPGRELVDMKKDE